MFRPSLILGTAVLLFSPILISEPLDSVAFTGSSGPIEILFSGVIPGDRQASTIVRVADEDGVKLDTNCDGEQSLIRKDGPKSVIKFVRTTPCPVVYTTIENKNYILPIAPLPPLEALADVSTETLKNTLESSVFIKNNYRLSSPRLQEFFDSIDAIIQARSSKFYFPISGATLPKDLNFLPNSLRPYRAESTDGIHHGWDFYVDRGTPVKAIEDGVIIHVKNDFTWGDMKRLYKPDTELNKQINLDVYRGNSVYLKTLSGHVAIYAHLMDIPNSLTPGTRVKKGDIVGHVGDSAVPAKKYLYHLHFELAMNPFDDKRAGVTTFNDVLMWPFWGKGNTTSWVAAHDETLFQ